jgi:hypothetical protein
VTTKDTFTDEEWTRIVCAPFVAGLAISLADPKSAHVANALGTPPLPPRPAKTPNHWRVLSSAFGRPAARDRCGSRADPDVLLVTCVKGKQSVPIFGTCRSRSPGLPSRSSTSSPVSRTQF